MAQLIAEESLLREPNLWVPGKKPIGRVKIDRAHPKAGGIHDCMIFQNNIIDDLNDAVSAWTRTELENSVTDRGQAVLCVGGTDVGRLNCQKTVQFGDAVEAGNFTLFYICKPQGFGGGGTGRLHEEWTNTSNRGARLYLRSTHDGLRFAPHSSTFDSNDINLSTNFNKWWVFACVRFGTGTNECSFFAGLLGSDIAEEGTFTYTNTIKNTGSDRQRMFNRLSPYDRSFDGDVLVAYTYANRALNHSEINNLANDPYQFLIPA